MANNKRVKDILKHSDELKLSVESFCWGKLYLGGLYDFRVSTCLFGKKTEGIGIDSNEEVAFLKAFSESIERAYCQNLGIRSHGLSAHWSKEEAKTNSRNELIERDVFLCHYLAGTGGKRVENSVVQDINSELSKISCRVKLYELTQVNDNHTYICIGENGARGNIIGLASGEDKKSVIQKAAVECLFRLISEAGITKDLNITEISNPIDHYHFHISSAELNKSKFVKDSSFSKKMNPLAGDLKIKYEVIGDLSDQISGLDLKVVKAKSDLLQPMFYGKAQKEFINFDRIKEFVGRIIDFKDIEPIIHPIG